VELDYQKMLDQYPFLSYLTYGGNEYIGVIQNIDDVITSIYDYAVLKGEDNKKIYLELAESWWWESNRMVPINIFLKQDWQQFRPTLKTFNSKDVVLKYGPAISLKENAQKRSKRRSITLVRRVL
jgi:ABC-type transport system substrate-binding protein